MVWPWRILGSLSLRPGCPVVHWRLRQLHEGDGNDTMLQKRKQYLRACLKTHSLHMTRRFFPRPGSWKSRVESCLGFRAWLVLRELFSVPSTPSSHLTQGRCWVLLDVVMLVGKLRQRGGIGAVQSVVSSPSPSSLGLDDSG